MKDSFGLAPVKREGQKVEYDFSSGLFVNPYEHPKWVYPHRRREVARNYFTWELLHGTPVEDLRKDYYWKYFEEDEDAKT